MLTGKKVRLDAIEERDLDDLQKFFGDFERTYLYLPERLQLLNQAQLKLLLADWQAAPQSLAWAIRPLRGETCLGLVTLESIDPFQRSAECGVALLQADYEGRGFASEAMRLLLSYCFGELNLHRLTARYLEGNESSALLFEKLGFREEGCLRRAQRRGAGYLDVHLLGLLASEHGEEPLC